MSELFDAVDALVASASPLPPPGERKRLRAAHGLTLDQVAGALKVRRATVSGWESGKTEPRPPEREAYARLLRQLAELYPVPAETVAPVQDTVVPEPFTGPAAPAPREALSVEQRPVATGSAPDAAATTTAAEQPAAPRHRPGPSGRHHQAVVDVASPGHEEGGGEVHRRPGRRRPALRERPARGRRRRGRAGVRVLRRRPGPGRARQVRSRPGRLDAARRRSSGAPKLSGPGKDADPLIVLTAAALERYGLPVPSPRRSASPGGSRRATRSSSS